MRAPALSITTLFLLALTLSLSWVERFGDPEVVSSSVAFVVEPREQLPSDTLRFAVIGDYGIVGQPNQDVSTMVKGWKPDFIITTGDNNYRVGAAETIDANIGQYYHEFIAPYQGSYGPGGATNRFFPSLGNHDWDTPGAEPYLAYFTLPGNERYYDFTWGPLHFFALDSDPREPDGVSSSSTQARWLEARLSRSTAPWKIVYLHHAPFSSGLHGSDLVTQWPYRAWGASAVLAGHDHDYERVMHEGIPYFVNGAGGSTVRAFLTPIAGSEVRYNSDFGAMLVEASAEEITFRFITRAGLLVDEYTLQAAPATATPTPMRTPTTLATPLPETLYLPLLRR